MDNTRVENVKKRFTSIDKNTKVRAMLRQLCGAAKESDDDDSVDEGEKGLVRTNSGDGVLAKPHTSFQSLLPQNNVSDDDDEDEENFIDETTLFAENVEEVIPPTLTISCLTLTFIVGVLLR